MNETNFESKGRLEHIQNDKINESGIKILSLDKIDELVHKFLTGCAGAGRQLTF